MATNSPVSTNGASTVLVHIPTNLGDPVLGNPLEWWEKHGTGQDDRPIQELLVDPTTGAPSHEDATAAYAIYKDHQILAGEFYFPYAKWLALVPTWALTYLQWRFGKDLTSPQITV
jgi:hypothetical protein